MFQRFFDEGLAQSSYLVACARTREAAIVDPRRDIDVYVAAARTHGLTIVYAIETHVHADFVSGARELAEIGVRTICGPATDLGFPNHEARHRERLTLGDVGLTLLHTPGHTPEHISVLVQAPGAPDRVLTGDTLFVGSAGRPDLLGDDMMRTLAGQLYDSLHDVLLALDDDVEVHPGHGAGSLCGAGIGSAPSSTIGEERRGNALLQHRTRDGFVAAVLADLPDTPPYFPRMKALNRQGPPLLGMAEPLGPPPLVEADAARALLAQNAQVIDLRSADAFAHAHPAGALHLEAGPKVGYWAAWVVPAAAQILLVAEGERQASAARLDLLRVGIDAVAGYLRNGFDGWLEADLPVASIERTDVERLADRLRHPDAPALVDVRSAREFETGHLGGALHIPLNELQARAPELPVGAIATICETGYRSSLAASILARLGVRNVASVSGGMADYKIERGSR